MKNVKQSYHPQIHYCSDRLKTRLDQIRDFRTTFIEAPSGAGKTTAVQDFFGKADGKDGSVRWFVASEEPHTSGWARLCRVIGEIDPPTGSRLLRLGFPVEDNQGEIAQAFMELRCDDETYLVCDNFQFIQKNLPPSVWRALVDHGGEGLRIVILTQQLSSRGLVVLSNSDVLRVENDDLCLKEDEIGEYYLMAGVTLDENQKRGLHRYSEGWIAALYLQLMNYVRTGSLEKSSSIYELVDELFWKNLSRDDRQVLFRLSPFDNFTVPQACFILGVDSLSESLVEGLGRWMFIRYDIESRRYYPHSILLDFVRSALQDEQELLRRDILHRAGEWCADRKEKTQALSFFYRLRDYPAILSLDLRCPDISRATLNTGREGMLTVLRDIVDNSTLELRCDHAFSLISIAFEAFNLGDMELYTRLCREMEDLLNNCEMDEPRRRSLLGELYLARSFGSYNDIEAMGKDHSLAYELLGTNSVLFQPDAPWTFGWASVLGMFHSGSGKLDSELEAMDYWLPRYNSLTSGNGSGAQLIFRAEAMLHRGLDDEAEALALKALETTSRWKQDSLFICTAFLLQRIALLRGDGPGFMDSSAMRDERVRLASHGIMRRITEMATGFTSVLLDNPEGVSPRICDEGFLRGVSPVAPFACMVYGRLALLTGRERELLLRSEEILFPAQRYRNLLAEIYVTIYISVAQSRLGRENDGIDTLNRALEMSMPDGLILPFAENADLIGPSLDAALAQNWSHKEQELSSLKKRYSVGKDRIIQSLSGKEAPVGLTPRENDVALLVSEGMSNREIADKLYLSENTVKFYLKSVFQKLDISSRREVKRALRADHP